MDSLPLPANPLSFKLPQKSPFLCITFTLHPGAPRLLPRPSPIWARGSEARA